ncbi:alcohol dehydrogenase catalytic domain-containing protein [Oscillatoria laete-virens NRMC-F 0139]|nr:alcohol dehydrogenase catalytic domain-containing protein [Oscillatoria laete-virens]MDL5055511.1 alcohol dehydrogenase catalytic domain-containing protein [Oscillatoria laete-virens NRMC-F 0139]
MRTLFYPEFDRLEIADRPIPETAPDEVLLKVDACGICGSELETYKAKSPRRTPPLVMGHEFCGSIAAVGSEVSGHSIGKRVVSNSLVPCGKCVRCRRGDTHLCAHREIFGMHRGGAFAEYVNVPARCLIDWPAHLSGAEACLAEPLGNGVHVAHLIERFRPEKALVIGAGPIGLMCQQAVQVLLGSRTVVTDLSPERLLVAEKLGAAKTIQPKRENLDDFIREWTEGEGVDAVIDAVGAGFTKKQSLQLLRAGGVAVWIGLHENGVTLDSYEVTLPEKFVFGTYAAKIEDLKEAVALMADRKVDVSSWVQTYPLNEGVDAFGKMLAAKGNDIKAVIQPNH